MYCPQKKTVNMLLLRQNDGQGENKSNQRQQHQVQNLFFFNFLIQTAKHLEKYTTYVYLLTTLNV